MSLEEHIMRKNFGAKAILYPMPVLAIGTYDLVNHIYRKICTMVGKGFSDGTIKQSAFLLKISKSR